MKCQNCNNVLSQVAVPSYLGEIYRCDQCNKDFFYKRVVSHCPECGQTSMSDFQLLENWEDRSIEKLCPRCKGDEK